LQTTLGKNGLFSWRWLIGLYWGHAAPMLPMANISSIISLEASLKKDSRVLCESGAEFLPVFARIGGHLLIFTFLRPI
jgi:hypothetical protein